MIWNHGKFLYKIYASENLKSDTPQMLFKLWNISAVYEITLVIKCVQP